jgi:precorrin-2 dehydrogenase/sirohydrochlorin ferrochelatase
VLVGAGTIGSQKIGGLLAAGAHVHVVAPEASEAIAALARDGAVHWSRRRFRGEDLDGAVLVIAATGDAEVNESVFREARVRRVLCNAVDEPERCDFYYPAVVRRGDLQIAISTGGRSPALAQRIRMELEAQYGESYAAWLEWLGDVRSLFFRKALDPDRRRTALHNAASNRVYERFAEARRRKGRTR